MNLHTIDEMPALGGKYVLVRDDFNVQIVDGAITDAFRIEQSLPTLRRLAAAGARIVIAAHLGRPDGIDAELSLRPVALALEQLLGAPVLFVDDCLRRDFMPDMTNGSVAVLENLRFYPDEEKNDTDFARRLAEGMDFYVNDAFAVSHRAHASIDAITGFLPSFAGELLAREVAELTRLITDPARPLVGLISGSKVASKIGVIKALAKLCDRVIVSGVIGTTFRIMSGNAPTGLNLGGNVKDDINDPMIKAAVADAMATGKIVLPIDKGTAKEFLPDAVRTDKKYEEMSADDIIMDEGPESVAEYEREIAAAKTFVWNGTLGMAEWQPNWSVATFAMAKFVAERTAAGLQSIIGGGDTVAALEATDTKDKMSYVSTGGGAFLEFIEGLPLPGIKALEK